MPSSTLYYFVFATFLHLVAAQDDVPQCEVAGECQGQLIGVQISDTVEDCLGSCKETQGCLFYTFKMSDRVCSLFSTCPTISPEGCPTCISGEVTCPLIICNEPGVCSGTLLHQEDAESLLQCQTACGECGDCQYYSFSASNTICFLFSDCPEINESEGLEDAVTGQPGCPEVVEHRHWVLVGGGAEITGFGTNYVNLVSLDPANHPVPDCLRNPALLPLPTYSSAGGRNEMGLPMICSNDYLAYCLVYDPTSNIWTSVGLFDEERYFAGSVGTDKYGLIVTGGYAAQALVSTVITKNGNAFDTTSVPNLPEPAYHNCLVAVEELDMIVSIGGDFNSRSVFSYTRGDSEWVKLNNTLRERSASGCGVVRKSSGDAYIVVAGGDIGAGRRTTDILDLATMEWREGPSLPHDYCEMDSVQYGNTFALVGGLCNGVVDEVYLYDSIGEDWTQVEGELISPARYSVNAILVDQNLFPECSD